MAEQVLMKEQHVSSKRMANMELLRIIAMIMVVVLHYLGKGNLLPDLAGNISGGGFVPWALEALCIVAVNVYMLISGYFLVESRFKVSRVLGLIFQALFYSILVPAVLVLVGVIELSQISVYQLLYYVFPTQMEHYWFLTAYVVMYLISPLLGRAVRQMNQRQHGLVLVCLLVLLSLGKSILPVRLEMDRNGYDAVWFICVYLVAAYIRLYGIGFFKTGKRSVLLYFVGCGMVFGITMALHFVYIKTGSFAYVLNVAYDYNHIVNLFAAVALFYAFLFLKIPEGKVSNLICKIAPYTFGVYLLHEQYEIRYQWPYWLGAGKVDGVLNLVIFVGLAAMTVLVVGVTTDLVRTFVFKMVGKLFGKIGIAGFIHKLDTVFAETTPWEENRIDRETEKE